MRIDQLIAAEGSAGFHIDPRGNRALHIPINTASDGVRTGVSGTCSPNLVEVRRVIDYGVLIAAEGCVGLLSAVAILRRLNVEEDIVSHVSRCVVGCSAPIVVTGVGG